MKVLFLLPTSYPNGPASAKLIQRLAIGLTSVGVTCEVFCVFKEPQVPTIYRTDSYGIQYSGIQFSGGKLEKLRQKITFPFKVQRFVNDAIVNRGVTLVWIYNPSWFLWRDVIKGCKETKTPVVAHLVEQWPFRWHLRMIYFDQQLFLCNCWRHLSGVVAISTHWLEYASLNNIPAVRIPVPCPPIEENGIDQLYEEKSVGNRFDLFYAGQLYRRDLPNIMLQAMQQLACQKVPVKLTIVGRYDVWAEGRAFYKTVQNDPILKDHIVFTGYLTDEEYKKCITTAHAIVLLHSDSPESRACFPTRLPEFLCTGKPVITSSVGDIPLYLQNNIHAILLSRKNSVDELVTAIMTLVENPNQSIQMGLAGNEHARDEFSIGKLGKSLETFLSGL